jgi:LysM repeat protein
MNNDEPFWQRFGGHLVLLIIALLLAAASKTEAVSRLLDLGREGEPVVEALAWQAGAAAPIAAQTTVISDTEEIAPFDLSSVPVLSDNSLAPALIPITYKPAQPQHELITYTVESGDTAIRIAERFGIQEETILGGNSFLSNDAGQLMAGVDIIILPVDGVLHDVVEGETLESISELYGIPVEAIIAYEPNNLEFPFRLHPGTQILVPGAIREVFVWDPPALVNTSSPEAGQGITVLVPGTGTYIWPTGGRTITQYSWYGHTALDVSLSTGSPIYASDTGTVTYATWSPYCYGNLVVINHGNGYETFYAHLDGFNVTPGQTVYQGNVIAYSGNTGCSSGPHLHFEIRLNKARYDPLGYLP